MCAKLLERCKENPDLRFTSSRDSLDLRLSLEAIEILRNTSSLLLHFVLPRKLLARTNDAFIVTSGGACGGGTLGDCGVKGLELCVITRSDVSISPGMTR